MTDVAAAYPEALQSYLGGAGESALQQAYEIGRSALNAGIGLVAIADIHHACLRKLLAHDVAKDERKRVLDGGRAVFCGMRLALRDDVRRISRSQYGVAPLQRGAWNKEAKRIASALHDEAGQLLVAVYIALQNLCSDVPAVQPQIHKVTQLLDQIEVQLRRLSHELVPALLNDLGLVPALRYLFEGLAQRSHLQISIDAVPDQRLPGRVETTLYHVAKEALHNVIKHARATSVWVTFSTEGRFDQLSHTR